MKRRAFLTYATRRLNLLAAPVWLQLSHSTQMNTQNITSDTSQQSITLFLCGDVMTGRGIDQVLPHPGNPELFEYYINDARRYVELAEAKNGKIKKPVTFDYIWGDALKEFARIAPDLRIINLETSITRSNDYWPGKGINYRMHPQNISCLTSAGIDGVALANNHVMDWGHAGLQETMKSLALAKIKTAGAGANIQQAQSPAIFEIEGKGRVLLFSFADKSSGVPYSWMATENRPGVNMLYDLSKKTVQQIASQVAAVKSKNDIVIASLHWGGNWGYEIPGEQQNFAHKLIDEANVDIIHGHSSHHPKGIEVYKSKTIFYGCGDFINDYEGISGYEQYRDDLSLMYFITVNTSNGELERCQLVPTQIKKFRVNYADHTDAKWLADMLNREGRKLNTQAELHDNNSITVYRIKT